MWLFLPSSFLSIVEPPDREDVLLVRARIKNDIQRIFPKARVTETVNRDYRFRALIPREQVADAIYQQVMNNHAGNFKASVGEDLRHDAYSRVWGVMWGLQNQLAGKTIPEFEKSRPKKPTALFPDDEY